jgi:hypothetical protein
VVESFLPTESGHISKPGLILQLPPSVLTTNQICEQTHKQKNRALRLYITSIHSLAGRGKKSHKHKVVARQPCPDGREVSFVPQDDDQRRCPPKCLRIDTCKPPSASGPIFP